MPRDFRSFTNEHKNVINENKDQAENYEQILNKYKDMDNNELMSNLFSEASKLKREGKLDDATLSNLKTSLSPFLNEDQQNMLNSLISAISDKK